MPIRDILVTVSILGAVPFVMVHPYIGALLWVIVGVMNPHRLSWGFAYDLPFAAIVAGATFIGLVVSRDPKRYPINAVTVTLALFALWMCITTPLGFYPDLSYTFWARAMKVLLMTFVAMIVIHDRRQIDLLIWSLVISLGFYGVKGGIFTLTGGGAHRVYGPSGSFVEDNNSIALALIMAIPLMAYLFAQNRNRWLKLGLLAAMGLTAFAALGSHSRGAFLAIGAMAFFLWWRSRQKIWLGMLLVIAAPVLIGFMPEEWIERMESIRAYDEDASAQGRINAWWLAFNVAKDRITGGGFYLTGPSIFAQYAPNPDLNLAAHSIYFQVLGEHGFPGLFLFLAVWGFTWLCGNWIIRHARRDPELAWASSLAAMIQVSLVAYAVGGAFLSLSYFDLPYYELAALVVVREIIREKERSAKRTPETTSPVRPIKESMQRMP